MKKILSLILCVIFVFSLTACGENKGGKSNHSVDIEYYAKLGQIDGVEYKLGDDVDKTQKALSAAVEAAENNQSDEHASHEGFYYDLQSGDYTVMTDGAVCCCYVTDKKEDGITHIVKYGGAYGFEIGAVSTQVRDTMSEQGYEATEREAENGELFFLPGSAGMTVLKYEIKERTVKFIFAEHALSAVVIHE